jgi:hypothetical protein
MSTVVEKVGGLLLRIAKIVALIRREVEKRDKEVYFMEVIKDVNIIIVVIVNIVMLVEEK